MLAAKLPLSACPSTEVWGPAQMTPELPPPVQPEKLPDSKPPLATRFVAVGDDEEEDDDPEITGSSDWEMTLTFPAASVAVAVRSFGPLASAAVVTDQLPLDPVVAVPTTLVPS